MPLTRNAVTFARCQLSRSSRRTMAIFVSKRMSRRLRGRPERAGLVVVEPVALGREEPPPVSGDGDEVERADEDERVAHGAALERGLDRHRRAAYRTLRARDLDRVVPTRPDDSGPAEPRRDRRAPLAADEERFRCPVPVRRIERPPGSGVVAARLLVDLVQEERAGG